MTTLTLVYKKEKALVTNVEFSTLTFDTLYHKYVVPKWPSIFPSTYPSDLQFVTKGKKIQDFASSLDKLGIRSGQKILILYQPSAPISRQEVQEIAEEKETEGPPRETEEVSPAKDHIILTRGKETHVCNLTETSTLAQIQTRIYDLFNIPEKEQKLIYRGQDLMKTQDTAQEFIRLTQYKPATKILIFGTAQYHDFQQKQQNALDNLLPEFYELQTSVATVAKQVTRNFHDKSTTTLTLQHLADRLEQIQYALMDQLTTNELNQILHHQQEHHARVKSKHELQEQVKELERTLTHLRKTL